MSITLFCLVKEIQPQTLSLLKLVGTNLLVSSKKLLRKRKHQSSMISLQSADKLKLWKVEIPDDRDDQLNNLSLQDQTKLLATKKISRYFSNSPAEECIHVIVVPPVSALTSNREQELLNQLASLQELLNKSVYEFDVIVSPKRKAYKYRTRNP